jgi:hypothetical protein
VERRDHASIELDREHVRPGRRERDRERTEPGADLDDVITGVEVGIGDDGTGEVRVDQEVLAEGLGGADAVSARELADGGGSERRGRAPAQSVATS